MEVKVPPHSLLQHKTCRNSQQMKSDTIIKLSCNGAVSNIPLRLSGGRLYVSRHVAYALSGLYDKAGYGNAKNGGYDIYEDPATPVADR